MEETRKRKRIDDDDGDESRPKMIRQDGTELEDQVNDPNPQAPAPVSRNEATKLLAHLVAKTPFDFFEFQTAILDMYHYYDARMMGEDSTMEDVHRRQLLKYFEAKLVHVRLPKTLDLVTKAVQDTDKWEGTKHRYFGLWLNYPTKPKKAENQNLPSQTEMLAKIRQAQIKKTGTCESKAQLTEDTWPRTKKGRRLIGKYNNPEM